MMKLNLLPIFSLLLISFLLFGSTYGQKGKVEIKCDAKGNRSMEEATRWLFYFGEPKLRLPENGRRLQQYCKEVKVKEEFIKSFSQKCLSSFPKQVIRLLMFSVSKRNKYFCSTKRGKKEVLTLSKCANQGKEPGNECMNKLIDSLTGIPTAKHELRLPLMCCKYFQMEECVERELRKIGKPNCPESSIDLINRMLEAYTGEALNFVCRDYTREDDKCSKIDHLTPPPTAGPRPFAVLTPVLRILESI